jgi:hypothetical protein
LGQFELAEDEWGRIESADIQVGNGSRIRYENIFREMLSEMPNEKTI